MSHKPVCAYTLLKNGKNERLSNLCAYTKNEKKKSVDGLFEKTVKKTVNALLRIHSNIPNTFLGPPGAPKKDMLFLGPQGAPIIRRFLVNNILFVLLIHFRYPLIDQKTQNLLGPQGAPKGNWKLFIRYASIPIDIRSYCRYNLVSDFCQFNLSFWYYAEKLLKGSSK